ncbi:MAG: type II toxin-antitoxin system RelE/ParE family toxin [Pseudomonadota bacterium]
MIKSFRHKRLARFFSYSERRGIDAKQADRIRRILDRLDAATKPEDMNISGFAFHGLSGNRKGRYSVSVSGNWRITFQFEAGDVVGVDLEDYH